MNERQGLVLVTGANGFVGSHLVEALLQQGYGVRCMVRNTSDLTFIQHLPVEWAYADVQDAGSLAQACQGVDSVCHCAALTGAPDEDTLMRINAQGTEALGRACIDANPDLKRFILVSSQAACGPAQGKDHFVDELCQPHPVTWYGNSKLAAEQALQAMANRLSWTIIRPSPVFGPRDRDFHIYFGLVKRGINLQLGREERWVSLIYVRDLVHLILRALQNPAAAGQIYFGCNQAHSYAELADTIAKALHKQPVRITLPEAVLGPLAKVSGMQAQLTGQPARLNEQWLLGMKQRYWLCSGEKARRELGFKAQYDLETAVRETAIWYQDNGWL